MNYLSQTNYESLCVVFILWLNVPKTNTAQNEGKTSKIPVCDFWKWSAYLKCEEFALKGKRVDKDAFAIGKGVRKLC